MRRRITNIILTEFAYLAFSGAYAVAQRSELVEVEYGKVNDGVEIAPLVRRYPDAIPQLKVRDVVPGEDPIDAYLKELFVRTLHGEGNTEEFRFPKQGKVNPLMSAAGHVQLMSQTQTPTPVTTWHYNNARTGANTTETILTPSNVKYQTFGKLWSKPVDGLIVGHPLYLPDINVPGKGPRNVVFTATMHDSVYAFDADSTAPTPLWKTSLLPAGAVTMSATLKKNSTTTAWTELGVISTPVIDTTASLIYLVAESYENSNVLHRLHALDIATGQERLGGPVTITATSVQNATTTTFHDYYQMNRPALLLANGHLYIAWGSNCCNTVPSQGWVLSYNAATLEQEGAYTTEPGQNLASIWMEGAGLSADSGGNIYGENGEGYYAPGINLSTSVLKLTQVGTRLSLADWFTPYSHKSLSADDLDLTGGVVILPDQPGPFPHEAIAIGKQGTIYVLNRDNMGHLCSLCTTIDTQIVQELPLAVRNSGTPVYWNNTVYFAGLGIPVVGYPLSDGQLGTPFVAPSVRGAGSNPILTANGNTDGILWFLDGNHDLWGLDAVSLKALYASGQAPNHRDVLPVLAHFASPIAADGKVFVGTVNSVVAYGLLPIMSVSAGSGQSGMAGTTLTTPLQVRIVNPSTQAGVSGISVAFGDGGKGALNPATAITDTDGFASSSYTLPSTTGTFKVTASATGYATLSFTETSVAKNNSKTTLVSNVNPATVGQAVTFTAQVTSSSASIPDGEIITFKNGTTVLGTSTLSSGTATFTTSALPAWTDWIAAVYPGDSSLRSSYATVLQKVNKVGTTTTLYSAPNPATVGKAVTFTATVTPASGSISNGETVTFKSGSTVIGTGTLSGGVATFTISTLPTGTSSIVATYPGNTVFRSSFSNLLQRVR